MKASRFFNPMPQFMYNSVAASGYKLHFFTPGTTTYKNIYTTAAKSVTVSNPVTLNSQGQLPSDVYLDGTYDVQFAAGSDTSPPASPIWTRSNVTSLTQFIFNVSSKTANYTVLETDANSIILCDATSGNITITLPTAASAGSGFMVWVKKTDASANTVTIDADGSETISGASTVVFTDQNNCAMVVSDATNWENIYPAGAGSGSVTSVTLTQPAAGLTITNSGTAITTSGTRTFALANDLAALEALSSTGLANRTASDTWSQISAADLTALNALGNGMVAKTTTSTYSNRTLTAGTGISITNGDGVSGNPTISSTLSTSLLQRITTSATGSTTSSIPVDDSIPQKTEGTELMTATITPTVDDSLLVITAYIPIVNASTGSAVAALFQDSTTNALRAAHENTIASTKVTGTIVLRHEMTSGTTSSTTFKVRIGCSTGTLTAGDIGAFGGVDMPAYLSIEEIAV